MNSASLPTLPRLPTIPLVGRVGSGGGEVTIAMDMVQNFSSGSGSLTAAKLDSGQHGESWGGWSQPELPTSHTVIENHSVKLPIPFLIGGLSYDGSEGQGATFDESTAPLGADTYQLGVTPALGITSAQMIALVKCETVLDGGSPTNYNLDLFSFAGADFTVPQRQHQASGIKLLTAHSSGDLGASVTDSGTWLLLSVFHDVDNQHGRLIVQEVTTPGGGVWVLGAILGTSTSNHAVPSGALNYFRFQDYLRPASGTGSIKVKIFGLRRSSLDWPMYSLGTIPPPTSVVASQTLANRVTLTWVNVCDIFRIERKTGSGSYSTLVSEFENNGTQSYNDDTVATDATYTYRVTTVIGSQESSPVESNVITIDNSYTPASGNRLWLKADTIGLADNAAITTWNDSSGLGNNLTQSVAGSKPTYKTNIVNGKPVVRGDGGDFLSHTGVVSSTSLHTMMVVLKKSSGNSAVPLYNGNPASNGYGFFQDGSGNRSIFFGGAIVKVDGVPSATDFEVWTTSWDGVNSTLWVNGAEDLALADPSIPPAGAPSGDTLVMGLSGGNQWTGDIAEVLLWDNVLGTSDRQTAENYLGIKYGITITH